MQLKYLHNNNVAVVNMSAVVQMTDRLIQGDLPG